MPIGNHIVEHNTSRFDFLFDAGRRALLMSEVSRHGTGLAQLLIVLLIVVAALVTMLIVLFENGSGPPDLERGNRPTPLVSDGALFPCPDYSGLSKTAFAETLRGKLPAAEELRPLRIVDVCHVSVF